MPEPATDQAILCLFCQGCRYREGPRRFLCAQNSAVQVLATADAAIRRARTSSTCLPVIGRGPSLTTNSPRTPPPWKSAPRRLGGRVRCRRIGLVRPVRGA